jgi:hypothetical protein
MPRNCIVCAAVESQDLELRRCAACQSTLYCSEACQKTDRRIQHKQICKSLNVGRGAMQVRTDTHLENRAGYKQEFERNEHMLDEDEKRFFKLFEESTFEGRRAAALEMKAIANLQTKRNQHFLLFHSLRFLVFSDTKKLRWRNSPLLVLLQFVDPNVLCGQEPVQEGSVRFTPLHKLSSLADPSDYSNHENQLILAKQLIKRGANVNAVSSPRSETPLHEVCHSGNVTNLDFVELLLEAGADPNVRNDSGDTPLAATFPYAPNAAKLLLERDSTDVNITSSVFGEQSFLATVRAYPEQVPPTQHLAHEHARVAHEFVLEQWHVVEEMLVERGAFE